MSYIVTDINQSRNDLENVKNLISGLNVEQQKLVISSSQLSAVERTKLELLLGETTAITANTAATTANNIADEDALLDQWLLIAGEKAETYAKAESTTATNADTVATIANNAAKKKKFFYN